jgi:hypothetical protein
MKNFGCGLILLLAAGILFSCGSKTREKKFFDVPGYFMGEIEFIKQHYSGVSKTTVYNDDTSFVQIKVADTNWEKEFSLFLGCDINKPIYYSSMKYNFPLPSRGDFLEEYIALNSKAPIRRISIDHYSSEHGPVKEIKIEVVKKNLISSTHLNLRYTSLANGEVGDSGKIYFIEGTQVTKGLRGTNSFKVAGTISK